MLTMFPRIWRSATIASDLLIQVLLITRFFDVEGALGHPLGYRNTGALERRGCSTVVTQQDRIETEAGLKEVRFVFEDELDSLQTRELANKTIHPIRHVTFDVYWHVVYANETYKGGYVPDEQIMKQMDVLNEDFKAANISWVFKNITRIENPDWFVNAWPGSPQEKEMKHTYHKGNTRALNIFTAIFNSTDKSLGYASLPSSYFKDPTSDGLMIRYSTLPGGSYTNYNHGRTTVHEIGHWLGLYHTFEGGCEGVGDNVDDTAPESSGSVGCPIGRKSCPDSKLPDPIHNFMDYSFDTCMTHFTPGQVRRMHEAIWAFRTVRPPVANSTSTSSSAANSTYTSSTGNPTRTSTYTSVPASMTTASMPEESSDAPTSTSTWTSTSSSPSLESVATPQAQTPLNSQDTPKSDSGPEPAARDLIYECEDEDDEARSDEYDYY